MLWATFLIVAISLLILLSHDWLNLFANRCSEQAQGIGGVGIDDAPGRSSGATLYGVNCGGRRKIQKLQDGVGINSILCQLFFVQ
jgi:hypothetical protein